MKKTVLAVLSTVAIAATTTAFASTAPTFVGKGDVQTVLGWNNAQLQAGASGLAWAYTEEVTTVTECEKIVETKKETRVLQQTRTQVRTVSAVVDAVARKNAQLQINGFWVTIGQPVVTTDGPIGCPNDNSEWTMVSQEETVTASEGLTVNGMSLGIFLPGTL